MPANSQVDVFEEPGAMMHYQVGGGLGHAGAKWYAQAVVVAFTLAPLSLIFYINILGDKLAVIVNLPVYLSAVCIATLQGAVVSYFSWRCYRHSGEPFLRWLTLGFLGFTVNYAGHGLAAVFGAGHAGLFQLYGPASRLMLALMLLKAVAVYAPDAVGDPPGRRRRGWAAWLAALLGVNLAVALGGVTSWGADPLLPLSLEMAAFCLLIAVITVILGRSNDQPLIRVFLAGVALLAEASLSFLFAASWNQQWWLAHLILAGGYLLLSYAVVKAFLTTRCFAGFESAEQVMARLNSEVGARRQQTEQLAAVFRTVIDGIITIDADGVIDGFNPAAERIFGYAAEDVVGRDVSMLMPEPDRSRHQSYVGNYTRTGQARVIGSGREVTGLRKDGSLFPLELSVSEIAGLTPRRFTGVVRDITERQAFQQEILSLNETLEARIRARTEELRNTEERLRDALSLNEEVLWASGVGLLVWRQDGQCVMVNPAAAAILGDTPERLKAETFRHLAAWRQSGLLDLAEKVLQSGLGREIEIELATPSDRRCWLKCHLARLPRHDGHHLLAVIEDISEERRVREELRLAASVFHNSAEGVMITDADGVILSVNPAFSAITGYSEREALGQTPKLLKSDRHRPEFYAALWETLIGEGCWQGEIWNRRKGGEAFLEWLTINRIEDSSRNPTRYVAVFHDITELYRKDEHIRHLAFHDALTDLPNRALVLDRLSHAVERARRENAKVALLFLDLDRFKLVNDSLGHDVGDLLLIEVSRRLTEALRKSDTIARLGGDEFLVLVSDFEHIGEIAEVAEKILRVIGESMHLNGHEVRIGASIGVALFPDDGDDGMTLLKGADAAMYQAKGAHRNTFRFHDAGMDSAANQRISLEAALHNAIARREFELYYQPKIDLALGRLTGAEALIRWNHKERGVVGPNLFIPLAEETDLILRIGDWVLEEACRQMADWRDNVGLEVKVAVNVCTRQLLGPGIAARIEDLLRLYAVDAGQLEIEVTESSMMSAPESAIAQLNRIRDFGITIAVDDFGTGYSSLAYLKHLPLQTIKIDRSFVQQLDEDANNAAIVMAIIGLSKALKLSNVAEGVETAAEEELLRSLGCHSAQGYRYAKPMPADQFVAWVAARVAETAM